MPDLLTFSDRIYVDPVMLGIFVMGLIVITVMVMTFRHNLKRADDGFAEFPVILTILLGEVFFSHILLFTLALYPQDELRLSELEIGILMSASIAVAMASIALAGARKSHVLRQLT